MNRLTNNDKNWGPFILARWSKQFSFCLESGDDEDPESFIRIIAFGWALQCQLPRWIIRPWKEKHIAHGWDEATVKRMGRNWYWNIYPREYGISLSDMGNGYDFLQVYFGPQTNDSSTTKSWCKHLPWKQLRSVRHSFYNPDGSHFWTEVRGQDFRVWMEKKEACPSATFTFKDYDGAVIKAECRIEEHEWHKGEGWFKWLKWFSKPMIRRSMDLKFSAEVGPEKGSWKGGTVGHSTDMLPGETPEQAFRRYCDKEHERKGRKYKLSYLGAITAALPKECIV